MLPTTWQLPSRMSLPRIYINPVQCLKLNEPRPISNVLHTDPAAGARHRQGALAGIHVCRQTCKNELVQVLINILIIIMEISGSFA